MSVTQQRQTPMPQAIIVSSDTKQSIDEEATRLLTAFIIGVGPQTMTEEKDDNSDGEKRGRSETKPLIPLEPSSVEIWTGHKRLNSSISSNSLSVLAPKAQTGEAPQEISCLARSISGATPTPPPTSRGLLPALSSGKPLPSGKTVSSLSPGRSLQIALVASPTRRIRKLRT